MTQMTRRLITSACLLVGLVSCSVTVRAAECDALKALKVPGMTITDAQRVDSGEIELPTTNLPLRQLPVFCRVTGVGCALPPIRRSISKCGCRKATGTGASSALATGRICWLHRILRPCQ